MLIYFVQMASDADAEIWNRSTSCGLCELEVNEEEKEEFFSRFCSANNGRSETVAHQRE